MYDDPHFSRSLKRHCFRKAQQMSPADTWNLRLNAIKERNKLNPYLMTILFSSSDAYYIEYLEEKEYAGGSKTKKNLNKGFIRQIALALERDLNAYFNEGKKLRTPKFSREEFQPLMEQRIARHNRSLDVYKMRREVG